MADNGKDAKRAEFNDYEHPLRTDDAAAQEEVAKRIKQAMRTGERRAKAPKQASAKFAISDAWDGSILTRDKRYVRVPMGKRPRLTQEDLVGPLALKDQPQVSRLIRRPGDMDLPQVFALRHALGVTLDWLRYGGENRYGAYEDDCRIVGMLYDRLAPHDKEHVFYMLTTLLGERAEAEVYRAENDAYMQDWLDKRPEEREKIEAVTRRMRESLARMFDGFSVSLPSFALDNGAYESIARKIDGWATKTREALGGGAASDWMDVS